MSNADNSVQNETKGYLSIFGGLIFLTLVSVGIYFLHLNRATGVVLFLLVAVIQAVISTSYLMHLISEKKLIYMILILTVLGFIGMVALIIFGHGNLPNGAHYVH